MKRIEEELNLELRNLVPYFRELGIRKVNFMSLGNSIASGYSNCDVVKPLLERSLVTDDFYNLSLAVGLDVNFYNAARAQNNRDEHIYNWILNNTSFNEISRWSRNDYQSGPSSMNPASMKEIEFDKYYPYRYDSLGIRDVLMEKNPGVSNIVIYSGATGSFLDSWTRNGNGRLSRGFIGNVVDNFKRYHGNIATGSIKRDIISMEAILQYIQNQNRFQGTNTQVYLSGAPDFLNCHITNILSKKVERASEYYANTSYVSPVKSKFFYHTKYVDKAVDIHYDEEEYLRYLKQVVEKISSEYLMNQAMIDIDRKLYHLSTSIEFQSEDLRKDYVYMEKEITDILEPWHETLKADKQDMKLFYKQLMDYYLKRKPNDFHYVDRELFEEKVYRLSR